MMNDGKLSQEEIDALLKVPADEQEDDQQEQTADEAFLTSIEKDALGEIGNISFGSSATTLSTLLNQKVEITTPAVTVIGKDQLEEEVTFKPVSVQVNYIEGFTGNNVFFIKSEDAAVIADIMLGGDGTNPDKELNEMHLSAVQEAMNQMMGAAATSMSTVFNKKIDISPPEIIHGLENQKKEGLFKDEVYVKVFFKLMVGDLIDSNMVQLVPLDFAKELVHQLMNPAPEAKEEPSVKEEPETAVSQTAASVNTHSAVAAAPVTEEKQAEQEQPVRPAGNTGTTNQKNDEILGRPSSQEADVQEAAFSEFEQAPLNYQGQRNLDMLMDIPLRVTVELGRTKQSIKEILELGAGSIIELDKLAGEPVDILVNEKLVAEGEVVVIDENFGVRVTDIVSQHDRIQHLRK
ncbi:flagellar motor switch phosphatase FliY [Oceanobacillus oncorhynchi subsp. incaldanensis]|nr:flagellar motor switch phosphatase FliY [Oceanobacillus oncorhynchi]MDM8099269.1 flagellar motor switch phosphatase FliY [Oceanobacillus oncorhynchi]GIO18389.1 flagellar motor switch phosphatase FliY [Oceanobacillus oncorhynchi subsp. incaldanensis]